LEVTGNRANAGAHALERDQQRKRKAAQLDHLIAPPAFICVRAAAIFASGA
jgi:hypothetical protein